MNKIFIKPASAGAVVRHPEKLNHIISQDGEWVTDSIQWQRYLRHGDVVTATPHIERAKKTKIQKEGGNI